MQIDPTTYQFRSEVGHDGTDNRLGAVEKWDDLRAGVMVVHEQADGKKYIADGHHRIALAKRLKAESVNAFVLKEADGFTPADARKAAALVNLANGNGTGVDAAKIFRDDVGGATPDALVKKLNLPANQTVKNGIALSKLNGDAFGAVVNGLIEERDGAVIGDTFTNAKEQDAAVKQFMRIKPANADEARILARQIKDAGFSSKQAENGDLFGSDLETDSILGERTRLIVAIVRSAKNDKQLFATLEGNVGRIESAGNTLARDSNKAMLDESAELQDMLVKSVYTNKAIKAILDEGARALKDKPTSIKAIVQTAKTQLMALKNPFSLQTQNEKELRDKAMREGNADTAAKAKADLERDYFSLTAEDKPDNVLQAEFNANQGGLSFDSAVGDSLQAGLDAVNGARGVIEQIDALMALQRVVTSSADDSSGKKEAIDRALEALNGSITTSDGILWAVTKAALKKSTAPINADGAKPYIEERIYAIQHLQELATAASAPDIREDKKQDLQTDKIYEYTAEFEHKGARYKALMVCKKWAEGVPRDSKYHSLSLSMDSAGEGPNHQIAPIGMLMRLEIVHLGFRNDGVASDESNRPSAMSRGDIAPAVEESQTLDQEDTDRPVDNLNNMRGSSGQKLQSFDALRAAFGLSPAGTSKTHAARSVSVQIEMGTSLTDDEAEGIWQQYAGAMSRRRPENILPVGNFIGYVTSPNVWHISMDGSYIFGQNIGGYNVASHFAPKTNVAGARLIRAALSADVVFMVTDDLTEMLERSGAKVSLNPINHVGGWGHKYLAAKTDVYDRAIGDMEAHLKSENLDAAPAESDEPTLGDLIQDRYDKLRGLSFDSASGDSGGLQNLINNVQGRTGLALIDALLELADGVNKATEMKPSMDFVAAPNGNIDYITLPTLPSAIENGKQYPSAPVRLEQGGDYGKAHISAERLKDFQALGYASESAFLDAVCKGLTGIYEQKNGRLLLVRRNGAAKYAVVEVQANGSYYGVTTMFLEDIGSKPYEERGGRVKLWPVAQAAPSGMNAPFPEPVNEAGTSAAGAGESGNDSPPNAEPSQAPEPQREADTAYLQSVIDSKADESSPKAVVAKLKELTADPAMKELAEQAAEAFSARIKARAMAILSRNQG